MLKLAALERSRRVLGEEHKKTLASLSNIGNLLQKMDDYEGALDCYQQALKGQEKVLGRTHPSTLMTIMNMAYVYFKLGDSLKAMELYKLALDGYEKSLGTEHVDTKKCARNYAIFCEERRSNCFNGSTAQRQRR